MSTATKSKSNSRGDRLFALCESLFPICRSITGDGVRETLAIIQEHIDLDVFEIPSGKQVFDWTVPKEWNIKEAWIKDSKGNKIIDFADFTFSFHEFR